VSLAVCDLSRQYEGYVIVHEEIYGVVLRCHSLFKSDSISRSVHIRVSTIGVKV